MLNKKQENIQSQLPIVEVQISSKCKTVSLDNYYKLCKICEIEFPIEYNSYIERVEFLENIPNTFISNRIVQ